MHYFKIILVLLLGMTIFVGCGGSKKNRPTDDDDKNKTTATAFAVDVRRAFNQGEDDKPITPSEIVDEETNFDDLLD